MNTIQSPTPPVSTAPPDSFRFRVGVAAKSIIPWTSTSFALRIFRAAIRSGLRRAGITGVGNDVLWGPGFVLCVVEVPDPNRALGAIRQTLKDLDILDFCEIAGRSEADGTWRTVHPPKGAGPFERFLSEENFEAAREAIAVEQKFCEALVQFIEQKMEKLNGDPASQ